VHPDIGFVTQLGIDLETQLDLAAARDLDHVELLLDGSARYRRFADDSEDATAVRERLAAADLDVLVHLPFPTDIGSPYEGVRTGAVRTQRRCLDAAASLGAEKAVLHPESAAWDVAWSDRAVRPHVRSAVAELTAYGADRGVEICVENLFENCYTVESIPGLLAATDASMTLDTGHARVTGYDDDETAAFVSDHADRISHVHLNDTRDEADEHLPFGAGTVDFERILAAFPADWTGTLSLEVGTDSPEYLRTSVERLEHMLATLSGD